MLFHNIAIVNWFARWRISPMRCRYRIVICALCYL